MGYGSYVLPGETESRGYDHIGICDHPGCKREVDKGFGFLCYDCTRYFCEEHLCCSPRQYACFAGTKGQVCKTCSEKVRPLIILGPPRSGTTLLARLINLNEDTAISAETEFPLDFAMMVDPPCPHNHVGPRVRWGEDDNFHAMVWRMPGLFRFGFKLSDKFSNPTPEQVVEGLYSGFWKTMGSPTWFGDKSPAYCFYWETLKKYYPLADFVIIERGRENTAKSLAKQSWGTATVNEGLVWVDKYKSIIEGLKPTAKCLTLEGLEDDTQGTLSSLLNGLQMDVSRYPMDKAIDIVRNGNVNRTLK